MSDTETPVAANFVRHLVKSDLEQGKHSGIVTTRFPPEPNGFLHIGHAKSICLNFGIAEEFGGSCNLRFDDTNPEKEDTAFVDAIREDVAWLGFQWAGEHYASDYFDALYHYALQLIDKGAAYVDEQDQETIRAQRGTLTEPGQDSPFRGRLASENRALFERMRAGEFADGSMVLRAKIDMASPNINMRDPVIYRIRRAHHHRTGDAWCIYPMYDYTHCLSDAEERITHSLCTLEFADHKPLYEWVLEQLGTKARPEQTEFARLALEYTVVSKRKLAALVEGGVVEGWDDPRMPTLQGLRRRGFTPAAIRTFCERIGVTRKDSWIEMGVLEDAIRNDLNANSERRLAVLDPLRVEITNYTGEEMLTLPNHPQRPELGERQIGFSNVIYIEREDFAEVPPPKFKRLVPGGEVRLRGAYVIRCDELVHDESGHLVGLKCSLDHDTLGKKPEGRKVKGVIHWVSEQGSVQATVRLYDRLFNTPNPASADNILDAINPHSLETMSTARVELSLAQAKQESNFQFERLGYFSADRREHSAEKPVFNRTVTLRDTWENKA